MRLIYQNSNLLYFLWYMIIFATSQWYMYMYAVMSKPTFIKIIVELRGPWRDAKRSPISIPYIGNKRNPWVDFLMVIMASGVARGRVCTTAMTVLTPVKTRYLLTSITWPYRGLRLIAHQDQVFFQVDRWPFAGFSIGLRAHVWLTCWKQARIVQKLVDAHPGLNVKRIITFSLCIWWLLTQNRGPNNIQKTSAQSYKTQIKILLFPGLA